MSNPDNVYMELLQEQLKFFKALNDGLVVLKKRGNSYYVEFVGTYDPPEIGHSR